MNNLQKYERAKADYRRGQIFFGAISELYYESTGHLTLHENGDISDTKSTGLIYSALEDKWAKKPIISISDKSDNPGC